MNLHQPRQTARPESNGQCQNLHGMQALLVHSAGEIGNRRRGGTDRVRYTELSSHKLEDGDDGIEDVANASTPLRREASDGGD